MTARTAPRIEARWAGTHGLPAGVRPEDLTAPLTYVSSAEAGWENGEVDGEVDGEGGALRASAFPVPREMESYLVSSNPNIVLGLYAGGPLRVERREGPASWVGGDRRDGDLKLNWGGGAPYEVRAWSLSALPTRVLNLQLSQALVARAAEEVLGVDLAPLLPRPAVAPARARAVARAGAARSGRPALRRGRRPPARRPPRALLRHCPPRRRWSGSRAASCGAKRASA